MDQKNKKACIERYEKRYEDLGHDIKVVGWRSKKQQYARFKVLCQIADLNDKSVLDMGCGFGHLFDYLERKNNKLISYLGIDLSPKLIKEAKRLHKGKKADFTVVDIQNESLNKKFDYVIASGLFNAKLKDNLGFMKSLVTEMFKLCNKGLAFNMTTDYVDYKDKNLYYFNPEKVFNFCKILTKRVCLRHDYMPYEFTIYLYKDETVDNNHIFEEFGRDIK